VMAGRKIIDASGSRSSSGAVTIDFPFTGEGLGENTYYTNDYSNDDDRLNVPGSFMLMAEGAITGASDFFIIEVEAEGFFFDEASPTTVLTQTMSVVQPIGSNYGWAPGFNVGWGSLTNSGPTSGSTLTAGSLFNNGSSLMFPSSTSPNTFTGAYNLEWIGLLPGVYEITLWVVQFSTNPSASANSADVVTSAGFIQPTVLYQSLNVMLGESGTLAMPDGTVLPLTGKGFIKRAIVSVSFGGNTNLYNPNFGDYSGSVPMGAAKWNAKNGFTGGSIVGFKNNSGNTISVAATHLTVRKISGPTATLVNSPSVNTAETDDDITPPLTPSTESHFYVLACRERLDKANKDFAEKRIGLEEYNKQVRIATQELAN